LGVVQLAHKFHQIPVLLDQWLYLMQPVVVRIRSSGDLQRKAGLDSNSIKKKVS
jgi:hypothetical protein